MVNRVLKRSDIHTTHARCKTGSMHATFTSDLMPRQAVILAGLGREQKNSATIYSMRVKERVLQLVRLVYILYCRIRGFRDAAKNSFKERELGATSYLSKIL